MLYDGLLRFSIREAKAGMEAMDRKRACERISRSHAILVQLVGSLDPQHAPELCQQLQGVYLFGMRHLVRANIDQDPAKLDEIIKVLTPLRDAWATAIAEVNSASR